MKRKKSQTTVGVPLSSRIPDDERRRTIARLAIELYCDAFTSVTFHDWEVAIELAVTKVEALEGYIAVRDMEIEAKGTLNRRSVLHSR